MRWLKTFICFFFFSMLAVLGIGTCLREIDKAEVERKTTICGEVQTFTPTGEPATVHRCWKKP